MRINGIFRTFTLAAVMLAPFGCGDSDPEFPGMDDAPAAQKQESDGQRFREDGYDIVSFLQRSPEGTTYELKRHYADNRNDGRIYIGTISDENIGPQRRTDIVNPYPEFH